MERKYYEAYDVRYRQVHEQQLQWFHDAPSGIVQQTMERHGITRHHTILEIGCGEGRDSVPLLSKGYDILCTDVSPEAIRYCQSRLPQMADRFRVLDCLRDDTSAVFDFVFSVAVIHMLVDDADRQRFFHFIARQLSDRGKALVCMLGDGITESVSGKDGAFDEKERLHPQTGRMLRLVNTTCRIVGFDTLEQEIAVSGLIIREKGITSVEPDYHRMMYVLLEKP